MGNQLIVRIYHNHTGSRLHGYMNGDPVELVHEASFGYLVHSGSGDEFQLNLPGSQAWPAGNGLPRRVASALTRIVNGFGGAGWQRAIFAEYRAKRLRRVVTGDVLVVDPGGELETILARSFDGWTPVTEPLIPVTPLELAVRS